MYTHSGRELRLSADAFATAARTDPHCQACGASVAASCVASADAVAAVANVVDAQCQAQGASFAAVQAVMLIRMYSCRVYMYSKYTLCVHV
jgi:hypothetical protein